MLSLGSRSLLPFGILFVFKLHSELLVDPAVLMTFRFFLILIYRFIPSCRDSSLRFLF